MPEPTEPLAPRQAAEIVIETIMQMVQEGRPLMQRVLPEGEQPVFWEHYPDNDARDVKNLGRWYYHVHPAGDRDKDEHGHFHLFLHRTQLDDDSGEWSEPANKSEKRANVVHIAGLSIDHSGIPRSWFVTNRWVTDEWLYPSQKVIDHLLLYNVDDTAEDRIVNRFLTAMVAMYRGEIADLLKKRDFKFSEIGVSPDNPDNWENKEHDVLASIPIDLDAKLEELGLA